MKYLDEEDEEIIPFNTVEIKDTPLVETPYEIKSPLVKEYMASKMTAPDAAPAPTPQYDEPNRLSYALQAIGAGFLGKDPTQVLSSYRQDAADRKAKNLGIAEQSRKNKMEDSLFNQKMEGSDSDSRKSVATRKALESRFPELVKSYGDSWGNFTADDLSTVMDIEKTKEAIQYRKDQLESMRANRQDVAQLRNDERNRKIEEADMELAVPGYDRTGEVRPKADEAKSLRSATADAKALKDKLSRLRELVKTSGSFEYGGDAGAEMESLATEIQLLSKSKDMYDLGVLTGPDLSMLQKITANPSSLDSLLTRDKTRLKQIDTQLKSVEDRIQGKASSMGYKPRDSNPKKTVVDRLRNKKTGKIKVVYSDGTSEIIDNVAGSGAQGEY